MEKETISKLASSFVASNKPHTSQIAHSPLYWYLDLIKNYEINFINRLSNDKKVRVNTLG